MIKSEQVDSSEICSADKKRRLEMNKIKWQRYTRFHMFKNIRNLKASDYFLYWEFQIMFKIY